MFLKRKIHPDGSFDKYKARLVAGGDMQNKDLYEDLSSPTVSTSAVFTIIAIAAHGSSGHRKCISKCGDAEEYPGAYAIR
jgi:hypothetical protein